MQSVLPLVKKVRRTPIFILWGIRGEIYTGKVIEFNDEARTMTLAAKDGKNAETFIVAIPDAPYRWAKDMKGNKVVDFPYDKKTTVQIYTYMGWGEFAGDQLPAGVTSDTRRIENPPDTNVMSEFGQFKGRKITVFYTPATRTVNGQKEKYNDVWRIRF